MSGFAIRPVAGTPLWLVSASYYSPKLAQACRSVPGMTRQAALRGFVGYVDGVEQVASRLRALGLNVDSFEVPAVEHQLPASYASVRQYQKEGIDFCIALAGSGVLLADEMGLGKSLTAVRAARALRRKTIIVCPAHVRGVWERPISADDPGGEVARWWPSAVIERPYGLKPEALSASCDVVVIHYDIIHAWVPALLEWFDGGTIVFDEAHVLLSPTSRRSAACRELARVAAGRIALTGTPPTDRVRDLYNIVDTISPGRFGEFFGFALRYADAHKIDVKAPGGGTKTVWAFDGRSNIEELRARLDRFTLRRTKREVMKELPALTRQVVDVEVPAKARVGLSAALVKDRGAMRRALDAAADGKMKHVEALVSSHLEAGARVVVGTWRRSVCEALAERFSAAAPTAFIHGGVALPRRSKIIDRLRKTEGPCCLVANIDCASTGIDLTFASVMVVAELVWEPRDLVQLEARVHRFGQEDPVLIQYVIARGTGDELIVHAVINKMDNFLDLVEKDKGDGIKETLQGEKDEGLTRLAAALKKMVA